MKKLLFLTLSIFIIGCSGNSSSDKHSTVNKIIHGIAAKGAYFPEGSVVELRGSPVPTGENILVGYYPDGTADYRPETTPSEVVSTTVTGNEGEYNADVTGLTAPYLIRVQDSATGTWYYSYTTGDETNANVNPYTDWMVRYYYYMFNIEPDDCFTSGIFTLFRDGSTVSYTKWSYGFDETGIIWYNKSMSLPDSYQIENAMSMLQYVIEFRWNVDIGDIMTNNWSVGETYDAILDGTTLDIDYIQTMMGISWFVYDMMIKGIAYYYNSDTNIHVEIYSIYPVMRIDVPGIGNIDMTITETIDGVNHFILDSAVTETPINITARCNTQTIADATHIDVAFSLRTFHQ